MTKIIRLTENDLVKIVKRVISEQSDTPVRNLDFQPCIKKMFGDNVIDLTMTNGKTYKSIKGTGDYNQWYFFKGDTAWNPVQKKIVSFTCANDRIILNVAAQVSEKGAQMVNDQDNSWDVITNGQKVIGMGSTGPLVKKLQGALSKLGYGDPTAVGGNPNCSWEDGGASCDGKFGRGTKNALIQFQKNYNIPTDGIFGRQAYQFMYEKRASVEDVKTN